MTESATTHRIYDRHTLVLIGIAALAVVLLVVTGVVVKLYLAKHASLAEEWFSRGNTALGSGRPQAAAADFRNALTYSHKRVYLLRLAQALGAAGEREQARAYLLNLWEQEPGNGVVNLELARLAAQRSAVDVAKDYYHNAIYGVWQVPDPTVERRAVRYEYAEFLLAHNQKAEAIADLVELSANLPRNYPERVRVAGLFMRAGAPDRALGEYRAALAINPENEAALAGAGQVAFDRGDYEAARSFLARAVRLDPSDQHAASLLATTELALRLNPFAPRLSTAERSRRAWQAFKLARQRLRTCAAEKGVNLQAPATQASAGAAQPLPAVPPQNASPALLLQPVYEAELKLRPVNERALRRNPDAIYPLMDWVSAAEKAASTVCGPPSGADAALLLIGKE